MPALLVELELLGRVEVQRREEVGGLQVACHAGHLVALVVDRGADLGVEGPVLAELLVDVGDHVAVERAVGLRLILQSSVVAGEGGQRRGVVLARHAVLRVVDPHAAGDVEPVGDLPLERGVEHVAALVRFAVHALLDPVGVLDRVCALAVGPVLRHQAADGIPALVEADLVEIIAAGEEVERRQGVEVLALRDHVLVVLDDEVGTEVKRQALLGERRGVAGREVVAVVGAFGDDVRTVGRRYGDVGLVLLVAGRYRDRVDDVRAGVEEVAGVERAVDRRTPAEGRVACAVAVLHLGHHVYRREHRAVAQRDDRLVHGAALGVDDDHAVGGLRTVEGGGRRSGQHIDRLDVLGVDVGGALRADLVAVAAARSAEAVVVHRDTVDHVEGRVALLDRLLSTHYHARRGTCTARAGVDRYTGHLADQRIDEVGVLDRRQLFGLHLLDVVCQRLLLALDTEGRHDDGVHLEGLLLKLDRQFGLAREGDLDALVADEGHDQHVARACRERERSVDCGGGSRRAALDGDRCADHRTVGIGHRSLDGYRFPPPRGCGERNVFVLKSVGDARALEHLSEGFGQRAVFDADAHVAPDIDVIVRKEEIARLFFDLVHHALHRDILLADCHLSGLGV